MRKISLLLALFVALAALPALAQHGHDDADGKSFPELKAYHDVMAEIWHQHFPKDDWAAVRAKASALKPAMDAMLKAKLPAGYAPRLAQFDVDVKIMGVATDSVIAAAKGTDDDALKQTVIKMHEAFHDLIYNLNTDKDPEDPERCDIPE
jgi:hypothetical protein